MNNKMTINTYLTTITLNASGLKSPNHKTYIWRLNEQQNKTLTYIVYRSLTSDQKTHIALAGVAQWIECCPDNQRVASSVPSLAHAWVVGQVPSKGHVRGNHTLILLSISFSLPSSLSKNNK